MNLKSIQAYLGNNDILFAVHTIHAKDITAFSAIPDEREVVLMPGTRLHAKSEPLNLEEIDPQKYV